MKRNLALDVCQVGLGGARPGKIALSSTDRGTPATAQQAQTADRLRTGTGGRRTNENGGAIVIGHPLVASGARIMTTLVNTVEQRGGRYGLQTMREGGGMANATIIERL